MECLEWKNRFQVAYVLSIIIILSCPINDGANILVVPIEGSHWVNMKILIEELKLHGHDISVLFFSTSWYIKERPDLYQSIVVEMQGFLKQSSNEEFIAQFVQNILEAMKNESTLWTFVKFQYDVSAFLHMCHSWAKEFNTAVFENKTLLKRLGSANFDLILTDPVFATGAMLAYYLKLPLVYNVRSLSSGEAHFRIAPSPLSYVPILGSRLTDKMSFLQRTQNVIISHVQLWVTEFIVHPIYNELCHRYLGPDIHIETILQRADVWLMRIDFTFEFPRPTMPNIVYIGGFQCKPSKPLPLEFAEFVQSSGEHGIIVMSLGTIVSSLPMHITMQIAEAFAQVPQKVIWRYDGNIPPNIGNNTLLAKWIPQNDLLGHPKTRAFIAHGGTNGVYEAIYHGVPVVGMPLIFDQFDNLLRLEIRGAAKVINVATMRSTDLLQALNEVIHNTSYRENMQKLSALHRDQPETPMERAIFWIEYVARHKGAAHLRSESYQLPWYIYYSVDVMIFLLSLFIMIAVVAVLLLKNLCKIAWKRKQKTH
ncbi:UDP-glucuronosyltransferase 2A1-like [Stegostoma tigrinum]|uniref:UDP-glucuronosyltransferase 2A1-like n=1 Tax=Stegostoma tigrinum TaxID=3053191 RepID=UPI00286FF36A|nr:UDP-glucuronosyltransferase 2A1-like [Stegostoma tigrinum]XP_048418889.2 UDP-glucuronosyltransferase 2A1-like [Stegostoma tigrinum]XP_048418890.2 UDP-glucuronosyltransferase 2A1-like [Stegostoma tigrinum]XP_048418891.2 UDP-glucuronosyltransferase 2A1-like [Stegostoma tigrinum]XP_048418892.2 UDP-glucuronosyltransferase 2A1-like [Stegostoma tigrinum]XP_059495213.1 UDP-glucuronosyltransferase 2A1-like [Stegostoma tigrinum]XP_059495214.1 UDP-glucuronosyltransferase 2A1-like [Stegostoma tigrinu